MPKGRPTIHQIVSAAEAAGVVPYVAAVAGEIEGVRDEEAWAKFGTILAQAFVLASLSGIVSMRDRLRFPDVPRGTRRSFSRESFAAPWDESKHPRGQPENAGQFGPGGGGASSGSEGPAPNLSPKAQEALKKLRDQIKRRKDREEARRRKTEEAKAKVKRQIASIASGVSNDPRSIPSEASIGYQDSRSGVLRRWRPSGSEREILTKTAPPKSLAGFIESFASEFFEVIRRGMKAWDGQPGGMSKTLPPNLEEYAHDTEALNEHLKDSRFDVPVTTFRGISTASRESSALFRTMQSVGSRVRLPGFSSASVDPMVAANFIGDAADQSAMMEIETRQGSYIGGPELEVLHPHLSEFEVTHVGEVELEGRSVRHVKLRQIPSYPKNRFSRESFAAPWDESKHPRGQPENAGQFGPGGGGSSAGSEGPAPEQVEALKERRQAAVEEKQGRVEAAKEKVKAQIAGIANTATPDPPQNYRQGSPVENLNVFRGGSPKPRGPVSYFTTSQKAAESYVQMYNDSEGGGGVLVNKSISILNPAPDYVVEEAAFKAGIDTRSGTPASVFDTTLHGEDAVRRLVGQLSRQYDGAVLKDIPYGIGGEIDAYVLFNTPGRSAFARVDIAFPSPGGPTGPTFSFGASGGELFTAPFAQAIASFERRVPQLATVVKTLTERAVQLRTAIVEAEKASVVSVLAQRSKAIEAAISNSFWAADVSIDTTKNLKTLLAQSLRGFAGAKPESGLERGLSVGEFIAEARVQGAANLTVNRLRTIYRNATNGAYNDGRAEVLKAPEAKAAAPLVMIREIRDRRTRGNPAGLYPDHGKHWQMNGYVGTIEDLERRRLVPPCGHNCRGGIRPVSSYEAKQLDLLDAEGNPDPAKIRKHNGEREAIVERGEYPDPGWS